MPGAQCRELNAGRTMSGAHEMGKYYIIIIYWYAHLMCAEMARFIIK